MRTPTRGMRRIAIRYTLAVLLVSGCTAAMQHQPGRLFQTTPTITTATINPTIAATWPAPNLAMTPGATVPGCTYPRPPDQRNVTAATKRAVAAAYHYTGPAGIAYVEYDHQIPYSLCGADTPANIWPEPTDVTRQTNYVHNEKDLLEDYAAQQVRYHHWTLAQGQQVFRGDWRVAWCRYIHTKGVTC